MYHVLRYVFSDSVRNDLFVMNRLSIVAIDVLKGISYEGSLREGLSETFGGKGKFTLDWLLPVSPVWEDEAEVLGYQIEPKVVVDDWVTSQ